ncbi:hypothetical protein NIES2098_34360 [Calothrix sp. NIES-2098]|nr:hypothetical protein NIES2098_34360 [Calothrix sp. NIES-2098]
MNTVYWGLGIEIRENENKLVSCTSAYTHCLKEIIPHKVTLFLSINIAKSQTLDVLRRT